MLITGTPDVSLPWKSVSDHVCVFILYQTNILIIKWFTVSAIQNESIRIIELNFVADFHCFIGLKTVGFQGYEWPISINLIMNFFWIYNENPVHLFLVLRVLVSETSETPSRCNCAVTHDDVIKCKHVPRYWPFVRGIHRSPVNSPHKGQWRGALMFTLICAWINGWVNTREFGDWRRYGSHYEGTVMRKWTCWIQSRYGNGWLDIAVGSFIRSIKTIIYIRYRLFDYFYVLSCVTICHFVSKVVNN